jgi:hypothetical protein
MCQSPKHATSCTEQLVVRFFRIARTANVQPIHNELAASFELEKARYLPPIQLLHGAVNCNARRKRWVRMKSEFCGASLVGRKRKRRMFTTCGGRWVPQQLPSGRKRRVLGGEQEAGVAAYQSWTHRPGM